MYVDCPSRKLLALLKEVKSVTDALSQPRKEPALAQPRKAPALSQPRKAPAAGSSGFVLDYENDMQVVNNFQHFGGNRGQQPLYFPDNSDIYERICDDAYEVTNTGRPMPIAMLYPWTKNGKACEIAGQRVQLVNPGKAPDTLCTAGFTCKGLLRVICNKQDFGARAKYVYAALLRAINAVTTETRFYPHTKVGE